MGKDKPLNMPYPLVLASTSRYRSELLEQLGWPCEKMAPGVDESGAKGKNLSPENLSQELSRLKAEAVFAKRPDACVIGSDQVCALGDLVFDKPGSREKALEQLAAMQGKEHVLLTAVTLLSPVGRCTFLNKAKLSMRKLTCTEIESYLDQDRPYDCAGSYKLESRGIKLFEKIEMADHTAIIGLPLIELTNVLLSMGYSL
jgi:septum formation protein